MYVEISTKSNKIMIATIYRPPKAQAAEDTALYEEIKSIMKNKQAGITGDFNCPQYQLDLNEWGPRGQQAYRNGGGWISYTNCYPTKNYILDLVFASDLNLTCDCKVGKKPGGCDHHLIRFNIKTEYIFTDNKTKISDCRRANFNCACQLLPSAAWNRLNLTDADSAWTDFKNKLLEVKRARVFMKTRKVNGTLNSPWMTADIKRAINRKKRNHNLMKQHAMAESSKHYHRSLRACRMLIWKSKHNCEKKIVSEAKANPKRFFKYLRGKKKAKSNVGSLIDENGVLRQGSKQMAGIQSR